jgi:hypothetical protein
MILLVDRIRIFFNINHTDTAYISCVQIDVVGWLLLLIIML